MSVEFIQLLRDNLKMATASLQEMDQHKGNPLYAEALTNRFRLCFECTRHLLKKFFMFQGVKPTEFDRQILEVGMEKGLLPTGIIWQEILADRNRLVHEYSFPDLMEISLQIELRYREVLVLACKMLDDAVNKLV